MENLNILYKTIVGSHLYGLNTKDSDIDTKGVFLCGNNEILGINNYIEQYSDDKNDNTLYELNRFGSLLYQNNPNILELLYAPKDMIQVNTKEFDIFIKLRDTFLTKKCKDTFGGYSLSQISKARGLNKKIVNPVDIERKTPIDFCFVTFGSGSSNLRRWLEGFGDNRSNQTYYGLQKINNMEGLYNLYYSEDKQYNGIINEEETSNELRLSSIEKGEKPVAVLYFNLNGYSLYCKQYKEYWEWVNKRNNSRYNDNINNKHNYDGKNMMHCVRLIDTAINIAKEGTIIIQPTNKELLFDIRYGRMSYDDIMKIVDEKRMKMEEAFDSSSLPESRCICNINDIILNIRNS